MKWYNRRRGRPHNAWGNLARMIWSAYHLVENFRQMALIFFLHRKQERDWVVPLTKYRLIFRFLWTRSLALVIQTNGTEKTSVVSVKTAKVLYLERYYFFFSENFHRDEPFHLNSPWNFQVFHTNGKRSWAAPVSVPLRIDRHDSLTWAVHEMLWQYNNLGLSNQECDSLLHL